MVGYLVRFWADAQGTTSISTRLVLVASFGFIFGLAWLLWHSRQREKELQRRRKKITDLESEKAALLKPKRNTTSGKVEVDGISWSFTADDDTGEWLRMVPLCPVCGTQLYNRFIIAQFAIDPEEGYTHFRCDMCGKFKTDLPGTYATSEDKATRHILKKYEKA